MQFVQYGNISCQKKHWYSHKVKCNAAQTLSNMSDKNVKQVDYVYEKSDI